MTQTPEPAVIGTGPSLEFVEEDLVVALEHRRLVDAELARLQLRYDESEEVKDLGLVLLKGLKGLASRAMQVRAYHSAEITHLETTDQRLFTDLDAVLFAVRRQFAEWCGGWVPEMGKNRRISSVVPAGPGRIIPFGGDPQYVDPEIFREPTGDAGKGVGVGVVDTALYEPSADDDGAPARPFAGHATFVTSRIKQEAPAATLTLEALFDPETGKATAWDTAKAMVEFDGVDNTVDILNLSLGCRTPDGQPPLVMARAVERLASKVLIVAAAGNHGASDYPSVPIWPAALRNVVAVGAYRSEDGRLADFSPILPWVTVTAPGVDVVGAFPKALIELSDGTRIMFDGVAMWSGTSFAAATVSGAVAAAMTKGKTAREAFEELVRRPNGVIRKFEYPH